METVAHCNKCLKETKWIGNEKRQKCQSCSGYFPCYNTCNHVDCKLQRKEMKSCGCGMILELDKNCKCGG